VVVGTCGYKGPPDADGAVEIAYVEKLGFAHLGQVVDPEDGPVWRWERAPGSSPA
jgi:hypothetical protein